jgi:hypothetical protein
MTKEVFAPLTPAMAKRPARRAYFMSKVLLQDE